MAALTFITALRGAGYRALQSRLQPPDVIVLELPEGPADLGRIEATAEMAQSIREGVVVAVEADVAIAMDLPVPDDRITAERSDVLARYVDRTAAGVAAGAGFVSAPARVAAELFARWAQNYRAGLGLHGSLHWAIRESGLPCELRRDSAPWPHRAAIVHHAGRAAKRAIAPEFF